MKQASFSWQIARVGVAALAGFELVGIFGWLSVIPDFTWKGLLLTATVAWTVLEFLRRAVLRRTDRDLSAPAAFALLGALVFDAGGDLFHGYSSFVWYDQLAHFLGGFAGSVIFALAFTAWHGQRLCWSTAYLVMTSVAFFGVLYEIEEYLEDFFTLSHRLGDGPDTANDLLLNLLGGLAGVVVCWVWQSRRIKKQES